MDANIPTSMVMKELAKPRDSFMLKRGEYDAPGDKVERKLPEFLPALPPGAPTIASAWRNGWCHLTIL